MNKNTVSADWRPLVSSQGLEERARVYAQIREFFAARDVLEVDTPAINRYAVTDPCIDSIGVKNRDLQAYLHTSPEYAMKRLLAFFKQDIYQLCKVFRAAEEGRYHHQEFTMLEWYRVGWSYRDLMREVDELVKDLLQVEFSLTTFTTYRDTFREYCGLDLCQAERPDYIRIVSTAGLSLHTDLSIREYQELLLDQVIAPQFPANRLTFVYDFPVQQAALAKINQAGVAERFELYLGNIELANGFQELVDAQEQLQRFEEDNRTRKRTGKDFVEIDQQFTAALQAGLPECAGVALGVDRLLMVALGASQIEQVLTFTCDQP